MESAAPTSGNPFQLAARIRNGDRAAEAELATTFGERIMAMASARGQDPDAALDITQNVLIAVICAAREGRLRAEETLGAFVYGTARNLISNHFRTVARQREDPLEQDVALPSLEDKLIQAERVRMTREALTALGGKDRQILLLTLVEGMKPGEIARKMGLNPEVVRMRKSRALRKVVEKVQKMLRKARPQALQGATR